MTKPRYRYQQARLGQKQPQAIPTQTTISPLGDGYSFNGVGPRRDTIGGGWPWRNPTGDWVDATGTAQGVSPFWTLAANAGSGTTPYEYTVDVLAALQYVETHQWWNGFILHGSGSSRSIATIDHPTSPAPTIEITYSDSSTAVLPARVTASLSSTTSYAQGNLTTIAPSATRFMFLEFDRPDFTKTITAATLRLTVVNHSSGSGSLLGYVVNPTIGHLTRDTSGVSANYGDYDQNLSTDPSVLGVHRYVDGSAFEDFCAPNIKTYTSEVSWNSTLWPDSTSVRTGPTYFPELAANKWVQVSTETTSLVASDYAGEGFEPLAPGMGALRVRLLDSPIIEAPPEGQVPVSNVHLDPKQGGTAMRITLPLDRIGYQDHLFVRYYVRLGDTGPLGIADIKQSRATAANSPRWPSNGGKTGITPAHTTSYGGQSGFGGNGYGWTWRFGWADSVDNGEQGPEEYGQRWYIHSWDQDRPIDYKNASNIDWGFGRDTAVGAMVYPEHWYCVEIEHKLNTVMEEAPGFVPDGWYRVWIDGVLVWEMGDMAWRKLPLGTDSGTWWSYKSAAIRPFRELGFKEIWFNLFHGGTDPCRKERVMFMTGLAWGDARIGPMKGVALPDLSRTAYLSGEGSEPEIVEPTPVPEPPAVEPGHTYFASVAPVYGGRFAPYVPPVGDTALAQFAATVSPGQCLEFAAPSLNIYDPIHGYPFGPIPGQYWSDSLQAWKDYIGPMDSAWATCMDVDPVTKRMYFAGGRPESDPLPQKMVWYDAVLNEWRSKSNWSGIRGGHIYRSTCVIPEHRRVVYVPAYQTNGVCPMWDIDSNTYAGTIPAPPTNISSGTSGWLAGGALVWHPTLGAQGSILWVNVSLSRIARFDWATQTWVSVGRFSTTAAWDNNHMAGHYNAFAQAAIVGSGTATTPRSLVIVESDGSTRLSAPTISNVASNSLGNFVPHPTRSASISLCITTGRIVSYEWAADAWVDRAALPAAINNVNTIVASLPDSGALLIAKYGASGTSKTYVYRPDF